MEEIAIIGPTASGKSDLAIEVALKKDAYILSIDSLSVYKEVDIVSAKPSKEELALVPHFGIDELYLDEYFSVEIFLSLYHDIKKKALDKQKNLVIVGGSSFYLKMLLEGLSPIPQATKEDQLWVFKQLQDLSNAYAFLQKIDPKYMQKIAPLDKYRIEKALMIYKITNDAPSVYFSKHPPQPIIKNVPIYEIAVSRDVLRKRIQQRTVKMIQNGLIDEVCYLEYKYTRKPNGMKAIGIVETLDYLDGKIDKKELEDLITIHTAQLAKRQQTFNKSQFHNVTSLELSQLRTKLLK